MKEKLAAVGSLLASSLLSFCCPVPLALASLGLGSLGLGSIIWPLRPYLIALSLILLSLGFYRVYRRPTTRANRVLVWVSAVVFVIGVATPYVVAVVGPGRDEELPADDAPGTRRMTVKIDNLAWAPCCSGPAKEALAALPGVRRVAVSYSKREAILVVSRDADIDDALIQRALHAVNHQGHLQPQ
jgi:mercuric ion transport protein